MDVVNSIYHPALILTVRMDEASQHYFNTLRALHFPPERNFLKAHLTLFHKLPVTTDAVNLIRSVAAAPFTMQVTGLLHLGAGVAFGLESEALKRLHSDVVKLFKADLSPQDRQGFRAHVTIQNKTSPEVATKLLTELSPQFTPFEVRALGLDLWEYLGGPWAHKAFIAFNK